MAQLLDLPDELLANVVKRVPASTLPFVVKSCRRLRGLAEPYLYRALSYRELVSCDHQDSVWCDHQCAAHPDPDAVTTVQHFDRLAYAMWARPSRAALVHFVEIRQNGRAFAGGGKGRIDLADAFALLANFPNLRALHVAEASNYAVPVPPGLPLRALEFAFSPGETGAENADAPAEYDRLHALMARPGLEALTVRGIVVWALEGPQSARVRERRRSCRVKRLAFENGGYYADGLAEVLKWPRALEVFKLEAWLDDESYRDAITFSPCAFVEALLPQRRSLRELWLSGASPPEYATGTKAASLRRFRALHALRVPLSWLVFFETDWRAEYQPDGYVPGRAYELLPPGLEELQLELDVRLVMEENPAAFVREQTRYVREIVDAKPTWTPRLRRLLLWPGECREEAQWRPQLEPLLALAGYCAERGVELVELRAGSHHSPENPISHMMDVPWQ